MICTTSLPQIIAVNHPIDKIGESMESLFSWNWERTEVKFKPLNRLRQVSRRARQSIDNHSVARAGNSYNRLSRSPPPPRFFRSPSFRLRANKLHVHICLSLAPSKFVSNSSTKVATVISQPNQVLDNFYFDKTCVGKAAPLPCKLELKCSDIH